MSTSVKRVLASAAIYDLLVTAILIVPPLVPFVLEVIARVDHWMGFGTTFAAPDPTVVFFFNLAAAGVMAWAIIRILQPSVTALLVDIAYRIALVACQVWAVQHGASPILLGIGAVLLFIAVVEWLVWRRSVQDQRRVPV